MTSGCGNPEGEVIGMKFKNSYKVKVIYDKEENRWIGICDEANLILESSSLRNLKHRIIKALPEMIELVKSEKVSNPKPRFEYVEPKSLRIDKDANKKV